ncbi:MAG: PEP-CTERM sorting domain-containing protein [Planctomycetaceae bacterium]
MSNRFSILLVIPVIVVMSQSGPESFGDIFTVSDADFSGGVYDFQYFSHTNKAYVNGVEIAFGSLVMTNTGFSGPAKEGDANYWYANGYFNATQLAGDVTLGWDLSAVTSKLQQVELLTNAALFQFNPWTPHAFEDKLFGEIATPNAFGTGAYTRYFEYEGNNNTATTTNYTLLQDVTSSLATSWLSDPELFELRLGYEQHAIDAAHPNIPGKHLEIFRNNTSAANPSFQFRLTAASTAAVPEPSSAIALTVIGLTALARRRRNLPACVG